MSIPIIIAIVIGGLVIGGFLGYLIRQFVVRQKIDSAEAKVERMLQEAKTKQQDLFLRAKEKAIKIIEEAKHEEDQRRRENQEMQKRLHKRETLFDQKIIEFQEKQSKLEQKIKRVEEVKLKVKEIMDQQVSKLQEISGLTREQAEEKIIAIIEQDNKEDLFNRIRKLEQHSDEELTKKSHELISLIIQRCAASHAVDTTTTNLTLPNDEMKGRIIGKEGRNIKTIEQLTGTEVIVDETPETIMISGFSPVRRQVALRALQALIKDGRIHPARIEGAVLEAKKELALEMKKAGEDALYSLGIPVSGFDPKLVQILGRMKFRTSYGQNALQHSIEVAHISGMMAEELGADVTIAKKGGLFHDIGKAVDHDIQGAHPEIGYNILKKFKMPEEICYQSLGHHEDKPKTLEAVIVKSADAISGARPGARKATLEQYIQRLEELEQTANSFEGVEKVYAIQAGREVRIFVEPTKIDDYNAHKLAKDIAKKIESELQYPGEIKVTLIRETRVIEYAR